MSTHTLILYPHEVRAALDDRLALVVRPVKPQPPANAAIVEYNPADYSIEELRGKLSWFDPFAGDLWPCDRKDAIPCPLGGAGDRLCCKESWREFFDDEIPKDRTRAVRGRMGIPAQPDRLSYVAYGADGDIPPHPEHGKAIWRSPATMPAWASRITLEVVGVRAVHLGDLSPDDARSAGFTGNDVSALGKMCLEWQTLYLRHGFGIESRPWVWAVNVRRVAAQ